MTDSESDKTSGEGTAVVVPAFNAGRHLGNVLRRLAPLGLPVIVVDDGSNDNTGDVARGYGVQLVVHTENLGKGKAIATGVATARDMGLEFIITLDADGQHNPDEVVQFMEHQRATGADIVVGNRMSDRRNMPALRIFANRVTSAFVSLKAGTTIPDSQNGYRMLRVSLFERFRLETSRYETESEILIKAGRVGAKISSMPLETIYASEESSINPVVDTMRFLRLVFKSLFW